eukprot:6717858-Pyramimonas_sp.AAC.1
MAHGRVHGALCRACQGDDETIGHVCFKCGAVNKCLCRRCGQAPHALGVDETQRHDRPTWHGQSPRCHRRVFRALCWITASCAPERPSAAFAGGSAIPSCITELRRRGWA